MAEAMPLFDGALASLREERVEATDFIVPRDYHENLVFRAALLDRAEKEQPYRAACRALAERDIEFFFDALLWTYDPQKEDSEIPFILYPYQRDFIQTKLLPAINEGHDLLVDKTRKMGASWMFCAVALWYWLKPERGNDIIIGSRKEELVDKRGNMDTLIEKIRYMLSRLPWWMVPAGYEAKKHDHHMQLINPESGSYIKGEANNKSFGRGGRYKLAFLDEFAYWEFTDEDAWRSLADATHCRLPVSTPNGRQNQFARLRHGEAGNIRIYSIHWKLHPERDETWYEYEKSRRTDLEIAQELDISYESSAGKRFFNNYNPSIHRQPLTFNDRAPLHVCWDFGFHRPAVLFTQKDIDDRWMWLNCILGNDVNLANFADYVLNQMERWYPNYIEAFHYGDPRGNKVNDLSDQTAFQILAAKGIHVACRDIGRVTRAKTMKNLLDVMIDGKPALMINEQGDDRGQHMPQWVGTQSMWHVHEALLGGCHYDRKGDSEDYEKDGFYDHMIDAAGYGAVFLYPAGAITAETRRERSREVIHLQQRREDIMARYGKEVPGRSRSRVRRAS